MRAPAFSAITLLTLAVGIGANTAIFSVVESVLIKPLAYSNPEELISVLHSAPGMNITELQMSPSTYLTYREENRTLRDIGVFDHDTWSVTGLAEPEQVRGMDVSDGVLPLLGVRPQLGRWFNRKDDSPGSPATVMLSWGYWQRRFGGDPGVIGRSIVLDARAREIVGVMPQSFRFLDDDPELLLPLQFDRGKLYLGNFGYPSIARLKPGVTLAQASADVSRMLPIVNQRFSPPPGFTVKTFEDARVSPNLRTLKKEVTGDIGGVLWVLMGMIVMLLLIACANVANLQLVRAEARQQELAIRAALGASWRRIAAELLSESLTLAVIGGALGLALADGALQLLQSIAPAGVPRVGEIGIDVTVLLFALGVSVFSGLLFGFIPVLKYAGPRLATGLRGGGRTASHSRERHRARNILVIVQVALALVLLIGSGLMIRTFQAMQNVAPGFSRPAEIQTLQISINDVQAPKEARVVRMQRDILLKLGAIPGVSQVALSSSLPMTGQNSADLVFAQDHSYAEGKLPPLRQFRFVSPGIFSTMGNPLVAGRDLTWNDIENQTPIALISRSFAQEYWGGAASAMGKQIRERPSDPWREIVGVVADDRSDGVNKPAPTIVYWPMAMKDFDGSAVNVRRTMNIVIRTTRAGSASLIKEIQQAVWSINPDMPLDQVRTLDVIYRKSMARTSFTLVLLAFAGGMALLLGVVGIYGVIAYSVVQRTREIGIRMALGATHQELAGMFVRHGLRLSAIGLGCGLVASFALMRLMSSLLFGVTPFDPITYVAVALVLLAASALASYVPSRRTASVDPIESLRAE